MYKTEAQYWALGYVLKNDAKAEFKTLGENIPVYSSENVRQLETASYTAIWGTEEQWLAKGFELISTTVNSPLFIDGAFVYNNSAVKPMLRTALGWKDLGKTVKPGSQKRGVDSVYCVNLYSFDQCRENSPDGCYLDGRYSYDAWLKLLNRHVKKGEKAVARDLNNVPVFSFNQTAPYVPQGHSVTFNGYTLKFYS